jgi:hypothetical protein
LPLVLEQEERGRERCDHDVDGRPLSTPPPVTEEVDPRRPERRFVPAIDRDEPCDEHRHEDEPEPEPDHHHVMVAGTWGA